MVGMPHMVTKGAEFSVLDHHYSLKGGGVERIKLLEYLTNPAKKVSGERTLATVNLDGLGAFGIGPDQAARENNLDNQWFGYANGAPQDPYGSQTTGWWRNWRGDAEGIMRETLIRALRLSLGMAKSDAIDVSSVRHDPPIDISFRWCCGAPTFEGYIEWDVAPTHPHILVTFSTPANGAKIWLNFDVNHASNTGAGPGLQYETVDPNQLEGSEGMWVIAHETTYAVLGSTQISVPITGSLDLQSPLWWLSGGPKHAGFSNIVTTRIPEGRGGIANPPRTWRK